MKSKSQKAERSNGISFKLSVFSSFSFKRMGDRKYTYTAIMSCPQSCGDSCVC